MSEIESGIIRMISLDKRDWTYPLDRWQLTYMDMTYLISGEMWYLYNEKEVHLQSGDMILFPQGSYRKRMKSYIPVRYCSINVSYDDPFLPLVSGVQKGAVTAQAVRILETLTELWHTSSPFTHKQCMSLISFLYHHLLFTMLEKKDPYITEIKWYITKNLSEKLTLSDIAAAVHLSPEYCCTLFRKTTGQNLFEYITDQRMDRAKELLTMGNFSLQEIATTVGYADYNYFSRVFHKHTGMTPMTYKRSVEN